MGGRGGIIGTIVGAIAGATLGPAGLALSTGMGAMGGAMAGNTVGGIVDTLTKSSGSGGDSGSSAPPAPPPPPTLADPGVQQAEKETRMAAASAKGRASTMLMGTSAGATGATAGTTTDEPKTAKKYLLGS